MLHLSIQQIEMKINKTKSVFLHSQHKHFGLIMAVLLLQFFPVAIYSPFDTFLVKICSLEYFQKKMLLQENLQSPLIKLASGNHHQTLMAKIKHSQRSKSESVRDMEQN